MARVPGALLVRALPQQQHARARRVRDPDPDRRVSAGLRETPRRLRLDPAFPPRGEPQRGADVAVHHRARRTQQGGEPRGDGVDLVDVRVDAHQPPGARREERLELGDAVERGGSVRRSPGIEAHVDEVHGAPRRRVPVRQRREQHAVHPPRKQDTDERRRVCVLVFLCRSYRDVDVDDAQRDAALDGGGERRQEPVHRGVSRGVKNVSRVPRVKESALVVRRAPRVLRLAARERAGFLRRAERRRFRALDRRARRGARAAEPAQALAERAGVSRRRRRPRQGGEGKRAVFFSRRARVHAVQPGLELLPVVFFRDVRSALAAIRRDGRQDESRRAGRRAASRVAGEALGAPEEQAAPAEDVAPEPQALGRLVPIRQRPRAPQPGDQRGRGEAFVVRSPREDLVERREQRRGVVLGAGADGDAREELTRKREDVSSDVHEGGGARSAPAELEQGAEDVTVPVRRPVHERMRVGKDADASVPRPDAIRSSPFEAGDEVGDGERRGT